MFWFSTELSSHARLELACEELVESAETTLGDEGFVKVVLGRVLLAEGLEGLRGHGRLSLQAGQRGLIDDEVEHAQNIVDILALVVLLRNPLEKIVGKV
ncbi:hypothetical protein HG530_009436 [Fusarium avenaceum]|nr:hypothetical protein HG530_009436 [Fusarium avenaceum]